MISNTGTEAQALIEKGHQLLEPVGFMKGLFSSKTERILDAFDCFKKGADMFKLINNYAEAAKAFEQCANVKTMLKQSQNESLKEALFCYGKVGDTKNYSRILDQTITLMNLKGQNNEAAKYCWSTAEKEEKEGNIKEAIIYYTKAVENFEMQRGNYTTKIHMCLLKKAELMCLSNDENAANEAKDIYERVGLGYLKSPLSESAASEVLMKSVICALVYDSNLSNAKERLMTYQLKATSLEDSLILDLIKKTIEGMEEGLPDLIRLAFKKYKDICTIDKWYLEMYSQILKKADKNYIKPDVIEDDFL